MIVVADCAEAKLSLFLGRGDGTFNPATVISTMVLQGDFVLTRDFNGDGKLDLVIGRSFRRQRRL
jgi:hypothetical protein